MGDPTVMQWLSAIVMIVVLAVLGGTGTYYWWRQLRAGADRPWSERLQAAALGFVGLAMIVLPTATVGQLHAEWVAGAFAVTVLPALLLGAAWGIAKRVEYERTRQRSTRLGLNVPRRMVPPWAVGLMWLLVTALLTMVAFAAVHVGTYPQIALHQQAAQNTAADAVLVVAGFCVLAGGTHVWWQHQRRERARQLAVRRSIDDV